MKRTSTKTPLSRILSDERIRAIAIEGREFFDASSVVAVVGNSQHPAEAWQDLKRHEPVLDRLSESVDFGDGHPVDALDIAGVLRLIQSIHSPRAERLKRWLADAGRRRIDEATNPELAFLRAQ